MKKPIVILTSLLSLLAMVSCDTIHPVEMGKYRDAVSLYLEASPSDTLVLMSDADTLRLVNRANEYSYSSEDVPYGCKCLDRSDYRIHVAYSGEDSVDIDYVLNYESFSNELTLRLFFTEGSSAVEMSCFDRMANDVFLAAASPLTLQSGRSQSNDYVVLQPGVGLVELSVNGVIYKRR